MPIYEYECKECSENFEQLVMRSNEKVQCPSCGSSKLDKKFSTLGGVRAGSSTLDSSPCASGNCPTNDCSSGMCGLN